jgi:putative transposase
MLVDFKGAHYPKSAILYAVYFYLRYGVSYRGLEEIMEERGAEVDHATLNRWGGGESASLLAAKAQSRKKPTAESWRMDETYIKVKGKWTYYYRAVNNTGKTLNFMLSERRDKAAARRYCKRAIGTNGVPDRIDINININININKNGANLAGLQSGNVILKFTGSGNTIKILQVKYPNNIIEQDHRFVKRIMGSMLGFKAFHSAEATLARIETAHMIRKGQLHTNGLTAFQLLAGLAAEVCPGSARTQTPIKFATEPKGA